jgi:hypothetical protein
MVGYPRVGFIGEDVRGIFIVTDAGEIITVQTLPASTLHDAGGDELGQGSGSFCQECQGGELGQQFAVTLYPLDVPQKTSTSGSPSFSDCTFTYTGTGPTSNDELSGVFIYKGRAYWYSREYSSFWYSAIGAIDGTVTEFNLSDVAAVGGGNIRAVESLTLDGGGGIDDLIVFFLDTNRAVIYQGSNPNDSADWFLVGVFDIPTVANNRCVTKYGGDLLALTSRGLISLTQTMQSGSTGVLAPPHIERINPVLRDWFSNTTNSLGIGFEYDYSHVYFEPEFGHLYVTIALAEDNDENQVGATYVLDTVTQVWSVFSVYKGVPTRYGDRRDVIPIYDPDVVSNGDSDRRAPDFDFGAFFNGRITLIQKYPDDSSESSYYGRFQYGQRRDNLVDGVSSTNYDVQCSVRWGHLAFNPITTINEIRVHGAIYGGQVTNVAFYVGADFLTHVKQWEDTSTLTTWDNTHKPCSIEGSSIQFRLDFTSQGNTAADLDDLNSTAAGVRLFALDVNTKEGGLL